MVSSIPVLLFEVKPESAASIKFDMTSDAPLPPTPWKWTTSVDVSTNVLAFLEQLDSASGVAEIGFQALGLQLIGLADNDSCIGATERTCNWAVDSIIFITSNSLDIWLVFQNKAWRTQNLLCNRCWQACEKLVCWTPPTTYRPTSSFQHGVNKKKTFSEMFECFEN